MTSSAPHAANASDLVLSTIDQHQADLVALRHDLHRHPEIAWQEHRTSALVRERIEQAGWRVSATAGTGFFADLGPEVAGDAVALRADMDALPIAETSGEPWASQVPGLAHACGHDVHTTALVGAALALAAVESAGLLRDGVRLIFQPAEEVMPGGAHTMMDNGALAGIGRAFALHCDPTIDVGQVGLREGAITGAADMVEVRLSGRGGHTSRPHLTEDLVFALGKLITETPAVLSRRFDPRVGASLVWGMVNGGGAANVIPGQGVAGGTLRMLDQEAWEVAEELITQTVADVVAPYGVKAEVDYKRGVPPVVNAPEATAILGRAVTDMLGKQALVSTAQSLGGEDFAWYLNSVPGAMARLGTRVPGGATYDLHQGNFRADDRAVGVGAKVLAAAALGKMRQQIVT